MGFIGWGFLLFFVIFESLYNFASMLKALLINCAAYTWSENPRSGKGSMTDNNSELRQDIPEIEIIVLFHGIVSRLT